MSRPLRDSTALIERFGAAKRGIQLHKRISRQIATFLTDAAWLAIHLVTEFIASRVTVMGPK